MSVFKSDPSFERGLKKSPQVRAAVRLEAQQAKRKAEANVAAIKAPWLQRKKKPTFELVDLPGVGWRLVNTDHLGHIMEWGSKFVAPHAPLRRAVRAAGLHMQEHSK